MEIEKRREEEPMSELENKLAIVACLMLAIVPARAEDILVTQYKADPSGAPYGVGIEKGFFKKAGIDITGVISGAGGGTSVRSAIASDLGFGDVSPAPVIAAIEQGQDIKIVAPGWPASPESIRPPPDMPRCMRSGRSTSICARGNSSQSSDLPAAGSPRCLRSWPASNRQPPGR